MAVLTSCSIHGRSKTIEDTEKVLEGILPNRTAYMIHELLPSNSDSLSRENTPTRFIGLVTLRPIGPKDLVLPDHFFPSSTLSPGCLKMELGYGFLPVAWGKGYATEAVKTVLEACGKEGKLWGPFEKVFVRAIVNEENTASQRVLAKTDMKELGVHTWNGDGLWLAGKWRTRDRLHIYGMFVVE